MKPKLATSSCFIEGTNFQFAWDSTSLGWLKECDRKYYYYMICGYRKASAMFVAEDALHLDFGITYHRAKELYYKRRAAGDSHDDALDFVVDFCLKATWVTAVGPDGVAVSGPWVSPHPKKTRDSLLRTVIWNLDMYKDDTSETVILSSGAPAVELSFKFELDHMRKLDDKPYLLCGHMDRLGTFGDDKFVFDYKTTGSSIGSYFFEQYNPDNQMCQPAGTLVLTDRGQIPIEQVVAGDKVPVQNRKYHGKLHSMEVLDVANRGYSGKLFRIATKFSEHLVTTNHRCVVRLRENVKHLEAVYLMRKGNQYRIGQTSLRTKRDFKNGLSQRCRLEPADAMWLLAVTEDREEAWAIEQLMSLNFELPTFTFSNKSNRNFSATKQSVLDWVWGQVGDNTSKAEKLLRSLDQSLEHPIYVAHSDEFNELSFDSKCFVRACNLQHDLFEVLVLVDGNLEWTPATITSTDFSGVVYSLEVAKDDGTCNKGMYIANGILTGNSIYTLAARVIYNVPVAGVIVEAAQILVGTSDFNRGFSLRTEAQLDEFLEDTMYWFDRAERNVMSNYWPINDKSCHHYGGCAFRQICNKDPAVRDKFLESDYTVRPWNPLEPR